MSVQLTVAQIRAACGLLDWNNEEFAKHIGLTPTSVGRFMSGKNKNGITADAHEAIVRAFKDRVEFTDNQGVKLKPRGIEIFEGKDQFEAFYSFMYAHLEQHGGDVCLSVGNEKPFSQYRTTEAFEAHRRRMRDLVESGRVTFRVLTSQSNHFQTSTYAKYRLQPEQSASPTAFYAFGDCLALISFDHEPSPYVVLHKSGPFAEAYRQSFNAAWQNAKTPPECA